MALKFKRHETFKIREGWIEKALNVINENKGTNIFLKNDGISYLGVGANMVKSIKYWLSSAGLIKGLKNELTENAELILKYDPYLDDDFTLWLIHYWLVTNEEDCPVFNAIFNSYPTTLIAKDHCSEFLQTYFKEQKDTNVNVASMNSDISIFFSSYATDPATFDLTPEENMYCPLSTLGLLKKEDSDTYRKTSPALSSLSYLTVYYCLIELYKDKVPDDNGHISFNIDDAFNKMDGPAKVFNITRSNFLNYLNEMKAQKLITINKTAGLNMAYLPKKLKTLDEIYAMHEGDRR